MRPKQRMYAALEGKKVDCFPIAAPYTFLSNADHWEELTGLPVWKFYEWMFLPSEEHVKMYEVFREKLPFDIFEPWLGSTYEKREMIEIVHRNDEAYIHDKGTDSYKKVPKNIHLAVSGSPNETRKVFTKEDVKREVIITPADEIIRQGNMDYAMGAVKEFGDSQFIMGGVVNTFFSCSYYTGLTNLFSLLYDDPEFIRYLSDRILEKNIEMIRAMAKVGEDAIFIDDATATNDMISLDFYEGFSLSYMKKQVKEIQRLGKKAIIIYFGGIADRVEQILSIGADALIMEASMKGYINDFSKIAEKVKGRTCLFGNLNPHEDIEKASEKELYKKMKKQFDIGTKYGDFVTSTGSPLTPGTSISRMRQFIDLGHTLS